MGWAEKPPPVKEDDSLTKTIPHRPTRSSGVSEHTRLRIIDRFLTPVARVHQRQYLPAMAATAINRKLRSPMSPYALGTTCIGYHWVGNHQVPTLLDGSLLEQHMHILGSTGSGKTSRSFMPMFEHQIMLNNSPLFMFDLKGDDAAFHSARIAAEAAGRKFNYWTNVPTRSTRLLNVLGQTHMRNVDVWQIAQLLLVSLNLFHGTDYGAFYFSSVALGTLATALDFEDQSHRDPTDPCLAFVATESTKQVKTFKQLLDRVKQVSKSVDEYKSAEGLITVIRQLASQLYLNPACDCPIPQSVIDNALQIHELLLPDPKTGLYPVTYFYMRSVSDYLTVMLIYKMVVYQIFSCMTDIIDAHADEPLPVPPPSMVGCFTDEFQRVCDDSLTLLLEQIRSARIVLFMANQDPSQLRKRSIDLTDTVWSNLQNKLIFTCRDENFMNRLLRCSGERIRVMQSNSISVVQDGTVCPSVTYSEQETTYLSVNKLNEVSQTPGKAIFIPAQSAGVTQYGFNPIIVDCPYGRTKAEYEALGQKRWPDPTPETYRAQEPAKKHAYIRDYLEGNG